ncbi:hypothetical protein NMYAN_10376 [Nitrosomonas nitrosa]|uniref:Uncharacterized protein n=1 Tax=Nitrosomonas nitrosa TaxID=52442 RepID=A0A8H8YXN0_9PROT|nr:hypothetical protein NMYAN_10376 [Nitrosomonas nitrosa]
MLWIKCIRHLAATQFDHNSVNLSKSLLNSQTRL